MLPQFTIKYRIHRCGSCEQYGDTKEETVIRSDGKTAVRLYDHRGPDGHYRMINRAEGTADTDAVRKLYDELIKLICGRRGIPQAITDTDAEIVLEEPGLKISADARITDGRNDCSELIKEFMNQIVLNWKYESNR